MGVLREPRFVQLTTNGALAFVNMQPKNKKIEWTVTCREGALLPAAAIALKRGRNVSPGSAITRIPNLIIQAMQSSSSSSLAPPALTGGRSLL